MIMLLYCLPGDAGMCNGRYVEVEQVRKWLSVEHRLAKAEGRGFKSRLPLH